MKLWLKHSAVIIALLAMFSAAFGGESAAPETPKPGPANWKALLDYYVENGMIPGALLVVKSPDWGVRVISSGVAKMDEEKPLSFDTPFRIGTVTRWMTAVAVLQMESEWKVRLSQNVAELLGDGIAPNAQKVTLQDCLLSSSLLPDYHKLDFFKNAASGDNNEYSPQDILARLCEAWQGKKLDSPGYFRYSDTDYILAGLVAEKCDNRPLKDILKARVFDPAGMKASYFDTGIDPPANMAHGYTGFGGKNAKIADRTARNPSLDWAAGAVVSTPRDMLSYLEAIFASRKLLSENSNSRMTRFINDYDTAPEDARGMGMIERISNRGTFRGSEGSIPGYYCCAGYYIHGDAYILLFINTSDHPYIGPLVYNNALRLVSGAVNRLKPANGGTLSAGNAEISWSAGLLYGNQWRIYVGEDEGKVLKASGEKPDSVTVYTVDKHTYTQKLGGLQAGKKYFWRVDALRERPPVEQENDNMRFTNLSKKYPEMEYYFIPEREAICGPVFSFTAE